MSDAADKAADFQARFNDAALIEHTRRANPNHKGLEHCRVCGDPVGVFRALKLQAQLCIECTVDAQKRGEPLWV